MDLVIGLPITLNLTDILSSIFGFITKPSGGNLLRKFEGLKVCFWELESMPKETADGHYSFLFILTKSRVGRTKEFFILKLCDYCL